MKSRDVVIIAAIIGITILGAVYIHEGGDGIAFSAAAAAIATAMGYKIGKSEPQE